MEFSSTHTRTSAWFTVAVLCLAQIVSTIDRGMLALMVDPVRTELGISDVQIALLQGFAFAAFYVSVGIPLGFVADAVNRRRLLIIGVLFWSAATMASGLAHSFGEMFAARLTIGVGEAVLGPCAVGMIGDLFPENKRGRPMALYVLGSMVAFGIGSALTGAIMGAAPQGAFADIPIFAGLSSWRIAFLLIGALGLPLALLLLTLKDTRVAPSEEVVGGLHLRETMALLATRKTLLLPLYAMLALFAGGGAAASGWGAAMLTRLFATTPADAGKALGVAQIGWALAGALLASLIVDRIGDRWGVKGKIRFAGGVAFTTILACFGFVAPGYSSAVALTALVMGTSAVFGATMLSVIADIIPPQSRGVAVALYAFVMTMIGGSLGPLAVAGLTERVFAAPTSIGLAMAIVGALALSASTGFALVAARRVAST
jgi:MFS family permease